MSSCTELCFVFYVLAGDFEDFCSRASELRERSEGAPLFTVAQSLQPPKTRLPEDTVGEMLGLQDLNTSGTHAHQDEWQIL